MNMLSRTQVPGQPWWSLLARGIIAVLFGLAALFWPGLTLLVLIYIFGAYALVEGIIAIYHAFQERNMQTNWWMLLLEGIAGVIVGILVFTWPGITALILLYLIAAWALITGIIELVAAFTTGLGWLLVLAGAISIVLGIILFARPVAGILSLVWLIGIYAIIWGILLIVRAFQARSAPAAPSTPLG
jgi:uncharacterized membrane protein HdeD (DUF308 family)